MSIAAEVYDGWEARRGNYKLWHRNDFFTELTREAAGRGANTGACQDVISGNSNFQASSTVQQVQRAVDGTSSSATKIQGVQVATTAPTNGQVLVFDSTLNEWVPGSSASSGNKAIIGGASNIFIPNSPSFFSITGSYTDTTEANTQFPIPYNGTLKNWFLRIVNPANGYTFTLRKNGVNTAMVIVAGLSVSPTTFSNTSITVPVLQGDLIDVTIGGVAVNDLHIIGISIELDAA